MLITFQFIILTHRTKSLQWVENHFNNERITSIFPKASEFNNLSVFNLKIDRILSIFLQSKIYIIMFRERNRRVVVRENLTQTTPILKKK